MRTTSHDLKELASLLSVKERAQEVVDAERAKKLLQALRAGVAPTSGVSSVFVGRETVVADLRADLLSVHKGSLFRVLTGEYGSGKTITLSLLKEFALSQRYAVSFITLHPTECPLWDLEQLARTIIKRLVVSDSNSLTIEHALRKLAESFVNDGNSADCMRKLDPDFYNACLFFFRSTHLGTYQDTDLAVGALVGQRLTKKEMSLIGISQDLFANPIRALQNIQLILQAAGYKGLVILIDEGDTFSTSKNDKQLQSENSLREFSNIGRRTSGINIIMATTPTFNDFLLSSLNLKSTSLRYFLKRFSFKEAQAVAFKIRDFHIAAHPWHNIARVRDAQVNELLKCIYSDDIALPRNFVKCAVTVFDICQQYKNLGIVDAIKKA